MRRFITLFAFFVLAGCDSSDPTPIDAAIALDSGTPSDAGSPDVPDSSAPADAAADAPTVADASTCDTGQIETLLDGILYTSESDYSIGVVTHSGEGAAAPTEADVARLSGASAEATLEADTEDRFWEHVVIDPTRTPAIPDTRPAALRAAFEASTTDRIVVRVIEPTSPATVLVFLAGRTPCGALVWLSSASIET